MATQPFRVVFGVLRGGIDCVTASAVTVRAEKLCPDMPAPKPHSPSFRFGMLDCFLDSLLRVSSAGHFQTGPIHLNRHAPILPAPASLRRPFRTPRLHFGSELGNLCGSLCSFSGRIDVCRCETRFQLLCGARDAARSGPRRGSRSPVVAWRDRHRRAGAFAPRQGVSEGVSGRRRAHPRSRKRPRRLRDSVPSGGCVAAVRDGADELPVEGRDSRLSRHRLVVGEGRQRGQAVRQRTQRVLEQGSRTSTTSRPSGSTATSRLTFTSRRTTRSSARSFKRNPKRPAARSWCATRAATSSHDRSTSRSTASSTPGRRRTSARAA